MSFFITSAGPGDGANLGGLEAADAHRERLTAAIGAGDLEWRAYLSSIADEPGVVVVGPPMHIDAGRSRSLS